MENVGTRALTSQLADDLGWLEQHCRHHPNQATQAAQLRLAAALVRNCIGPFLDDQAPEPLHIAVVGGAGAGKSTVANFLTGSTEAESNPQAGFTRHPIAYVASGTALLWTGHLGFLGPLQRLTEPRPSNVDEDVYQVRRVPLPADGFSLLKDFVVWDLPDMTTWAATGYIPRLLEIAGLADVIVYVASDERYNDEVPTQFLHLILATGKPVIACLVKVREAEASKLLDHFRTAVLSRLPAGVVASLTIPQLTLEERADPVGKAARFRVPLINQVAVVGDPVPAARRRAVRGAVSFLNLACEQLLSAARQDMAALQGWKALVQQGQVEFDGRYCREYLSGERFPRFDEALVRLIDLLELPGAGKIVSQTLWVVRTPFRLLKDLASRTLQRPVAASLPEQPVLDAALTGWLDSLRKEAARRGSAHPLWGHIAQGFASGTLTDQARERFVQFTRSFQAGETDEVDRTARAIYEDLEKSPTTLNALRGGKFAIEVTAIVGTVAAGGINWHDFILVPLVAFVSQQLVELMGRQYVDTQREQARARQQALVTLHISGPMAEWLTQWPATGGSAYERLQQSLNRIPLDVQRLSEEVTKKLGS
jgi:hypothetical protein